MRLRSTFAAAAGGATALGLPRQIMTKPRHERSREFPARVLPQAA